MGIESNHPTTTAAPSSSTSSRKGKQAVFEDPTIETNISKDDTATTTSSPDTTMDSDSGEQHLLHLQQQHEMMTTTCGSLLEEDEDDTDAEDSSEVKSILQQQRRSNGTVAIRRDPSPTGSHHSEIRDQPQPLLSPSPIPDNGIYSGFDPLPRISYNQEWEIFNPSSVCSQGILPTCNVHFADQLDMMTVRY